MIFFFSSVLYYYCDFFAPLSNMGGGEVGGAVGGGAVGGGDAA